MQRERGSAPRCQGGETLANNFQPQTHQCQFRLLNSVCFYMFFFSSITLPGQMDKVTDLHSKRKWFSFHFLFSLIQNFDEKHLFAMLTRNVCHINVLRTTRDCLHFCVLVYCCFVETQAGNAARPSSRRRTVNPCLSGLSLCELVASPGGVRPPHARSCYRDCLLLAVKIILGRVRRDYRAV